MKITQITVHAGRTFNHPHESYSNFKPGLSMVADISENESAEDALKSLQALAEAAMDEHKRGILGHLKADWDREQQELDQKWKKEQEELAKENDEDPDILPF